MKNLSGVLLLGVLFIAYGCSKKVYPDAANTPKPTTPTPTISTPSEKSLAGKIVFYSSRTNHGDLYIFDPFSLKTEEFIIADSSIGAPRYNPFNNSIVFAQQEPNGRNIYQKNLHSNNIKFAIPNPAADEVPSWSPVANRIAYSMEHHLQNYSLITRDLNSGDEQVLFEHAMQSYNPVWSPDGSQIAFVLTDSTNNGDIAIINADGTEFRNLTNNLKLHGHPAWSPDGKKLLFYISINGNADLYTMDVETGDLTQLTFDEPDQYIGRYSLDGTKIAYAGMINGDWEIFIMDADGNNKEQVTFYPGFDGDPIWIPYQ
ncbi:MAG: PD40 domain-containing protein [Balneola sp.]